MRNIRVSEDLPNESSKGDFCIKKEKIDVEEEEEEGEVKEEKMEGVEVEDEQKQEKDANTDVEEAIEEEMEEYEFENDDYPRKESPLYSELHLALLESLVENVYPTINRTNNVKVNSPL